MSSFSKHKISNCIGISNGPSGAGILANCAPLTAIEDCTGINISPTGGASAVGIAINQNRDLANSYSALTTNTNPWQVFGYFSNCSGYAYKGIGISSCFTTLRGCNAYPVKIYSPTYLPQYYAYRMCDSTRLIGCNALNQDANSIDTGSSDFINVTPIKTVASQEDTANFYISSCNFNSEGLSCIDHEAGDLFINNCVLKARTQVPSYPVLYINGIFNKRVFINKSILIGRNGFPLPDGADLFINNSISQMLETNPLTYHITANPGSGSQVYLTNTTLIGGTSENGGLSGISNSVTANVDTKNNILSNQTLPILPLSFYYRTSTTALPTQSQSFTTISYRKNGGSVQTVGTIFSGAGPYTLAGTINLYPGDVIRWWATSTGIVFGEGFNGPFTGGSSSEDPSQEITMTNSSEVINLNFSTSVFGSSVIFDTYF